MKVYKYPVYVDDHFALMMPKGARPLCVQIQNGSPHLWAAVDSSQPDVPHLFRLCGTGHERSDISPDHYIGSFQLQGGQLVFHLFDGGELRS